MVTSLESRLKDEAHRLGFVACGICPADAIPQAGDRLQQWLALGAHGSMGWMEARAEQRASPQGLWPEAQSVIMLGMSYAPPNDPMQHADAPDAARISVYAQGADYHDVIKKQLKHLAGWLITAAGGGNVKVFVDTAPVMEKPLAAAAGLGWQGKHSNLVSRTHGSWLLLGAIYTTLDLVPDAPERDRCGSCDACQRACPTDAFIAPYRLDARRCISYLTIEHKGPIPVEFRAQMGNHVYGCDDCLAACPWNKFADAAQANKAFAARAELAAITIADLIALDDPGFRTIFAGSPIKRIGRDRMVRNALIAAGNNGDDAIKDRVRALLDDSSPLVRGAAIWALGRLDPDGIAALAAAGLQTEPDEEVRQEWQAVMATAH
ncbi:tRNA epoxyqueuosine(34) reductase QueG [Aquisediminimonas sediminicola]|uniref:tRNA epoxyqueuosine(34) reductase QueG n=1 Tax=Alteraquisediminimonas sediminicola TaxID=2676787 RepID=UPI001C8CFA63|nr:tRNA epoxyqueuosine(34) reductase QueG [Aquisediminimonas sediminicola]